MSLSCSELCRVTQGYDFYFSQTCKPKHSCLINLCWWHQYQLSSIAGWQGQGNWDLPASHPQQNSPLSCPQVWGKKGLSCVLHVHLILSGGVAIRSVQFIQKFGTSHLISCFSNSRGVGGKGNFNEISISAQDLEENVAKSGVLKFET